MTRRNYPLQRINLIISFITLLLNSKETINKTSLSQTFKREEYAVALFSSFFSVFKEKFIYKILLTVSRLNRKTFL